MKNTHTMNNAPTTPPTFNERTARALINELTTNGGCTLAADGANVTEGYAVGLGGAEALDPLKSYFDQVHRIVRRARKAGAVDAFGAWHDEETGLDYVEPVQVFDIEHLAVNVGRARGELAIFDLTNGVEIRL